jgi:uncharacterized delta-60 repeat protein
MQIFLNKMRCLLGAISIISFNYSFSLEVGARNALMASVIDSSNRIVSAGYSLNADQDRLLLARYLTTGALDTSFGTAGVVTTAISGSNARANALAIQADGKIVIAGFATGASSTSCLVARYSSSGVLDNTFGTAGIRTIALGEGAQINAVRVQSSKIIIAGSVIQNNIPQCLLIRLNDDGSFDTTFNGTGIVQQEIGAVSSASSLVIDGSGRYVIGGDSLQGYVLVRYSSSGSLDGTFGSGGIVSLNPGSNSGITSLALQSDGKIVTAGYVDGALAVSRFNTNGSIDTSFSGSGTALLGISSSEVGNSVGLQNDGKIVAAGSSGAQILVARFLTTGVLDTSFASQGYVIFNEYVSAAATSVLLDTNQEIVLAGYVCAGSMLARLNGDGTFDNAFGADGVVLNPIGSFACANSAGGPAGATGPTGPIGPTGPQGGAISDTDYVFAYDTTTQPVANANAFQGLTFNTDAEIDGWQHSLGSADYICSQTGLYLVQYDVIARRTSGSNPTISIIATKSGVEIPGSQSSVAFASSNIPQEISRSFIININMGEKFALKFTGNSTGIVLTPNTGSGTVRPSTTLTISRIG